VSEGLEYAGLKARSWDVLRGDTSDWADRAFYLDLIEERGQPVLDVGCGTGRLLLDFLAIGIDIDGVELSPDMVAILRAKADAAGLEVDDRVTVAAMESMALPRRYRLILVPSSSFQLLTDPTAAAAAMRRLHDHLEPNGTLAMPWIDISQDYPGGADDRRTTETTEPDGSILRLMYHGWFDAATGLEHTDERFVRLIDGTVVEDERIVRSPATRQYDRESIRGLHEAAGFDEVEWLSGFTRGPAMPDDRIVTTLARRPG
jgi:ubiquinone/menaquinone biosynthesis C-methylase UbiE